MMTGDRFFLIKIFWPYSSIKNMDFKRKNICFNVCYINKYTSTEQN